LLQDVFDVPLVIQSADDEKLLFKPKTCQLKMSRVKAPKTSSLWDSGVSTTRPEPQILDSNFVGIVFVAIVQICRWIRVQNLVSSFELENSVKLTESDSAGEGSGLDPNFVQWMAKLVVKLWVTSDPGSQKDARSAFRVAEELYKLDSHSTGVEEHDDKIVSNVLNGSQSDILDRDWKWYANVSHTIAPSKSITATLQYLSTKLFHKGLGATYPNCMSRSDRLRILSTI
jgi:hypothetical protein